MANQQSPEQHLRLVANLEAMLGAGRDDALLRYGLGNAYWQLGQAAEAALHLQRAVTLNPSYSAAWKLFAKSLQSNGQHAEAIAAYEDGIAAAERNGDIQAAKEMGVFLRRLNKSAKSKTAQ